MTRPVSPLVTLICPHWMSLKPFCWTFVCRMSLVIQAVIQETVLHPQLMSVNHLGSVNHLQAVTAWTTLPPQLSSENNAHGFECLQYIRLECSRLMA